MHTLAEAARLSVSNYMVLAKLRHGEKHPDQPHIHIFIFVLKYHQYFTMLRFGLRYVIEQTVTVSRRKSTVRKRAGR